MPHLASPGPLSFKNDRSFLNVLIYVVAPEKLVLGWLIERLRAKREHWAPYLRGVLQCVAMVGYWFGEAVSLFCILGFLVVVPLDEANLLPIPNRDTGFHMDEATRFLSLPKPVRFWTDPPVCLELTSYHGASAKLRRAPPPNPKPEPNPTSTS